MLRAAVMVKRRCAMYWISGPKAGSCSDAGTPDCGTMKAIPSEHLDSLTLVTTPDGGRTWRTTTLPAGSGVANTDTIIYGEADPHTALPEVPLSTRMMSAHSRARAPPRAHSTMIGRAFVTTFRRSHRRCRRIRLGLPRRLRGIRQHAGIQWYVSTRSE